MSNHQQDHSEGSASAYRAYLFGQDGKIERSVTISADSDEDAVEQVRALARSYEVELWDRSRIVIQLPAIVAR